MLVGKHRKTYNKYKSSLDPFFVNEYKEERRTDKNLLHEIEQAYITNKVCKPLESGNSKPFCSHLKWSQGTAKPPMKLVCTDGSYTEDAKKCADMFKGLLTKFGYITKIKNNNWKLYTNSSYIMPNSSKLKKIKCNQDILVQSCGLILSNSN